MASGFKVAEADRAALESWLRAPSMAQELALRAKVILASADGEGVRLMARRLEISPNTVAVWRRRYRSHGLEGLRTRPRAGRPRQITAAKEQAVISVTLRKPKAATHWSARRLAKEVGLSSATVHRIWQKYGLQPHRVETFKFSRDPEFEAKLADIAGLYLGPPERALVLCVDEKSQIQALNRTPPALPMWPGLPARMTQLHSPRHHQPVRRAGGGQRQSPRALLQAPYPPGVHRIPGIVGAALPAAGIASDLRQLRDP